MHGQPGADGCGGKLPRDHHQGIQEKDQPEGDGDAVPAERSGGGSGGVKEKIVITVSQDPMSATCLFCKFVDKTISVDFLYEDEECIAIADIAPRAPTHVLIIPKK